MTVVAGGRRLVAIRRIVARDPNFGELVVVRGPGTFGLPSSRGQRGSQLVFIHFDAPQDAKRLAVRIDVDFVVVDRGVNTDHSKSATLDIPLLTPVEQRWAWTWFAVTPAFAWLASILAPMVLLFTGRWLNVDDLRLWGPLIAFTLVTGSCLSIFFFIVPFFGWMQLNLFFLELAVFGLWLISPLIVIGWAPRLFSWADLRADERRRTTHLFGHADQKRRPGGRI